jgi:hypothetical protein
VAKIPNGADYLFGFQPTEDEISTASELFDYTSDWMQEALNSRGGRTYDEASAALDKQLKEAVDAAKESGTYEDAGLSSWEKTARFDGGDSGTYTTVLKSEGAPDIEMKWNVSVEIDQDDDGDTYLKESFNLKSLKLK